MGERPGGLVDWVGLVERVRGRCWVRLGLAGLAGGGQEEVCFHWVSVRRWVRRWVRSALRIFREGAGRGACGGDRNLRRRGDGGARPGPGSGGKGRRDWIDGRG